MTFTASNGIPITTKVSGDGRGYLLGMTGAVTHATASEEGIKALREFFQHEKDEQLGRWRWPENPDYVVYPKDEYGQTVVVNENTGHNITFLRGGVNPHGSFFSQCAIAYFAAHPEKKPWHDAREGEIWALTIGPNTNAYQYSVSDSYFEQVGSNGTKGIPALSNSITAGRRIWPVVS